MRRLIVNADDFGFTHGINRGILEAHARGIVTSSTLMANGPAFPDAVQLAKTVPRLGIGCHVVLIDGKPVLEAEKIPSLIERKSGSVRFRDGLKIFAVRALAGHLNPEQIEAETTAQIRKIQSAGIAVTHVDTHKHTHIFPGVLRPLLRAAAACGVRAVRNPFGARQALCHSQRFHPGLWVRRAEMRVLRGFGIKFQEAVDHHGFATPDGTLGIEATGTLDETLFRAIAENVPDGTWEFVCHPGYNDADLRAAKTRLRESRETELRVLTLPEAREVLAQQGVELISYRNLISNSRV